MSVIDAAGRFPGAPEADAAEFFAEQQTEHEFMRNVIAHFEACGWADPKMPGRSKAAKRHNRDRLRPYHTHVSKAGAAGFPDLVMVRGGRIVFAELKKQKDGRVSVAQQRWLDELMLVQDAIAAALFEAGVTTTMEARARAETLFGVYLWRPSDWGRIEEVAR